MGDNVDREPSKLEYVLWHILSVASVVGFWTVIGWSVTHHVA